MIDIAYWAMGTGATMIGVGITLYYQGQALRQSNQTKDIGERSYRAGIAWIVMGFIPFLIGFSAWLVHWVCPIIK